VNRKPDIWDLKDRDLVKAMVLISQHPNASRLNDWERGFAQGVQEAWVTHGVCAS